MVESKKLKMYRCKCDRGRPAELSPTTPCRHGKSIVLPKAMANWRWRMRCDFYLNCIVSKSGIFSFGALLIGFYLEAGKWYLFSLSLAVSKKSGNVTIRVRKREIVLKILRKTETLEIIIYRRPYMCWV